MYNLVGYILFELIRTFAFLLTVLTVLLVFVGVFREASESGLGPMQIVQIPANRGIFPINFKSVKGFMTTSITSRLKQSQRAIIEVT